MVSDIRVWHAEAYSQLALFHIDGKCAGELRQHDHHEAYSQLSLFHLSLSVCAQIRAACHLLHLAQRKMAAPMLDTYDSDDDATTLEPQSDAASVPFQLTCYMLTDEMQLVNNNMLN